MLNAASSSFYATDMMGVDALLPLNVIIIFKVDTHPPALRPRKRHLIFGGEQIIQDMLQLSNPYPKGLRVCESLSRINAI